jgi:HK97 family phage major capsid protein
LQEGTGTISDGIGRPLLASMQGAQDAPRWSIAGFSVNIASQLPDVASGATPVAFGNWKQV